jgi:RNA polymerase sigma factor for flagellar operon FliA
VSIEEHLPLVDRIVGGFLARESLPPWVRRDDLMSAGAVGLMDAASKFNPSIGVPFAGYAALRIRGAILDDLRRGDWMSKHKRRRVREAGENPASPFVSMDCAGENGETIGERIRDDADKLAREIIECAETKAAVRECVQRLPKRERNIVTLYYFSGLTPAQIARKYRLTRERIGQILNKAIGQMRQWLRAGPDALA